MDDEQERICKMIDQRNSDQAAVRWLEKQQEPTQICWTGRMVIFGAVQIGREVCKENPELKSAPCWTLAIAI